MPLKTPEEAFNNANPAPSAPDIERAALGAILAQNELINQATSSLKTEDFTHPFNRVYSVLTHLSQTGLELSPVFVINELQNRGELELIGGKEFVNGLKSSGIAIDNLDNYIKVLKQKSLSRQIISLADKMKMSAYKNESPLEIIDSVETSLFELTGESNSDFSRVSNIADTVLENVDAIQRSDRKISGLATGLTAFDNLTCGLQKSDLILICARPSLGKSALGMTITQNAAIIDPDIVCAFFSLEMSKEALVQRMISSTARVDSQNLRNGELTVDEWFRIQHSLKVLAPLNILIDDTPALSPIQLRAKALRLKAQKGRLDLVIIDFAQLMMSSTKKENRQQEMTSVAQELKAIAKELGAPLVVLSQLNRAVESRSGHRPQLADIRESGAWEQAADLVGFIYREEVYSPTSDNVGITELLILKQRMGATGTIRLGFLSRFTKFQNLILN